MFALLVPPVSMGRPNAARGRRQLRRLIIYPVLSGVLLFPLTNIAIAQITGPLDWSAGDFARQGTYARICVQNFRHRETTPLCVDFERQEGRTKYWIYLTGEPLCFGDAGDLDATLAELRQMLAKAREWSDKAKANDISTLEAKELFRFTHTHFPPNPVFGVQSRVLQPATFQISTQANRRVILLGFGSASFDEPEWPALHFVVDHIKDVIPKYEERAIPIERAEAAEKKKKEDLFKP